MAALDPQQPDPLAEIEELFQGIMAAFRRTVVELGAEIAALRAVVDEYRRNMPTRYPPDGVPAFFDPTLTAAQPIVARKKAPRPVALRTCARCPAEYIGTVTTLLCPACRVIARRGGRPGGIARPIEPTTNGAIHGES